ncbi:hypothetical protein TWF281_003273 [Arthrobotrys megalospora]
MRENASRPEEKELVILKLPQNDINRKKVYSILSQVVGESPWVKDEDESPTANPQQGPLDLYQGISPQSRQGSFAYKNYHDPTNMVPPPIAAPDSFSQSFTKSSPGVTDFYKDRYSVSRTSFSATLNQPTTESDDLLGFLAVVEHRKIDILPFQWDNSGMLSGILGIGGTAKISKGVKVSTTRGDNLGLVFKRTQSEIRYEDPAKIFRSVLSEVYILGHPVVREHPNINSLQGICWETINGRPWPVLIFKQAPYGDLGQFMRTEAGMKLRFEDKIKLCWEIGNALHLMHHCNAIHGDIKPENILIHKGPDGKYLAQVADFGYSTIFAGGNNEADIALPRSWPWTSPEAEQNRRFTFEEAKAADLFSYGLVCLWLLCYDTLGQPNEYDPHIPNLRVIEETKWDPQVASKVCGRVKDVLGSTMDRLRQGWALDLFFNRLLSRDWRERKMDIEALPSIFGLSERPLPLMKQYGRSFLLISKESFKLPALLSRITRCPRDVRHDIFQRLEERAAGNLGVSESQIDVDSSCMTLAYDVALCYELGLGVERDPEKVDIWLQIAGSNRQELDNVVQMVQSDTNGFYSGYENVPTNPTAEGDLDNERRNIEFSVPWIDAALRQEHDQYAEYEPRVIYMDDISEEQRDDLIATLTKGKDETGFFVSWMQLTFSNDSCPHDHPLPSHIVAFPTTSIRGQGHQEVLKEVQTRVLESLEAKKRVIGQLHQDTLQDINKLCGIYHKTTQSTDGILALRLELLQLQRVMFGYENPHTLKGIENLARLHMHRGEWVQARSLIVEFISTTKKVFGMKSRAVFESMKLLEALNDVDTDQITCESRLTMLALQVYFYEGDDIRLLISTRNLANAMIETYTYGDPSILGDSSLEDEKTFFNTLTTPGERKSGRLVQKQAARIRAGSKEQDAFSRIATHLEAMISVAEMSVQRDDGEVLRAKHTLALAHLIQGSDERNSEPDRQKRTLQSHNLQIQIRDWDLRAQNSGLTLDPEVKKEREALWIRTQRQLAEVFRVESKLFFSGGTETSLYHFYVVEEKLRYNLMAAGAPLERRGILSELVGLCLFQYTNVFSNSTEYLSTSLNWMVSLLEEIPRGDPDRTSLVAQYSRTAMCHAHIVERTDGHLNQAIELLEQEIYETDNQEELWCGIGCMVDTMDFRYGKTGDIGDLRRAILWIEQMKNRGSQKDGSGRTGTDWLWLLSRKLIELHKQLGDADSMNDAIDVLERLLREYTVMDPTSKDRVFEICLRLASLYLKRGIGNNSPSGVIGRELDFVISILATILPWVEYAYTKDIDADWKSSGENTFDRHFLRSMLAFLAICHFLRFLLDERSNVNIERAWFYIEKAADYTDSLQGRYHPFLDETRNSIASIKNKVDRGESRDIERGPSAQFKHLYHLYFPHLDRFPRFETHLHKLESPSSIDSLIS